MLWFKNLMVYRLSRDVSLRAEEMEKQLAAYSFTPCGSQDMAKTGWVPPMGSQSDALTHASSTGQIIVCARKEEKILPTPVVKQALEAKIFKLEAEPGAYDREPRFREGPLLVAGRPWACLVLHRLRRLRSDVPSRHRHRPSAGSGGRALRGIAAAPLGQSPQPEVRERAAREPRALVRSP